MPSNRLAIIVTSVLILAALLLGGQLVSASWLRWLYQAEASTQKTDVSDQEQRLALLSLQVADLQQVRKENDALREQLKFYSRHAYHFQVGYIISRDPFNDNLITLDLGSAEGVQPGQPVVVKDGIIIAKIIKTEDHKSVAELLTSGLSKLPVTTAGLKETSGLLVGSLGNSLRMQYIPTQNQLTERELVVTSGLENAVPAGLVVGTIERIESPASEVYKVAYIKPVMDYQQARLISVITE